MSGYPYSERYWAANRAWYRQRKAAQGKAKSIPGRAPERLVAKEARWIGKGSKYLAGRRVPVRSNWMERDDDKFSREILDLIAEIQPEVVAAMDELMAKTAFNIWRQWPVSSGLSRSLIALDYTVEGGNLVATISSRAPYTTFIRGQPHLKIMNSAMALQGGVDQQLADLLARRRAGTPEATRG